MRVPWDERLRAVRPPWVEHPGSMPADPFWRQSGEYWLNDIWKPFWDSLNAREQERYIELWSPPHEWWDYYLDPAFQAWLGSDDSI